MRWYYKVHLLLTLTTICLLSTDSFAKVRLQFLTWNGAGPEGEARRRLISAWESKHPDVTVKIVLAARTGYLDRYLRMNADGEAPDIIEIESNDAWKLTNNNIVEDLGRYLGDGKNLSDSMIREYINHMTYRGKISAIPIQYVVSTMAYNTSLFADAGLQSPNSFAKANLWNWATFLAAARKTTKDKNGDKQIDIWGYGQYPQWSYDYWVYGNGGALVNPELTRCTLDSTESIDALQFQTDLTYRYKVAPQQGYFVDDFGNGRIGMCLGTNVMFNRWKAQAGLKWDLSPFPYEKKHYVRMSANGLAISRQSKRKVYAWDFIRFITGTEAQRILATEDRWSVPANLTVARSDTFLGQKLPDSMSVLLNQALKADSKRTMSALPLPEAFEQTVSLELGQLWATRSSASEVVSRILPALNKMLDDWNRRRNKKK